MVSAGDVLAVRREFREWKDRRRAGPAGKIAHRQKIKEDIRQHLQLAADAPWPEAIIRDVARLDDYPQPADTPWGVSPWFKVETKGIYHRGLEVLLKLESVVFSETEARATRGDEAGETVGIVGRIPFDSIVSIDWIGDEYYPQPHVYCWFENIDGPYESIEVYRQTRRSYWEHLDGVRFKPRHLSRWRRWRLHNALRKAQSDFERRA